MSEKPRARAFADVCAARYAFSINATAKATLVGATPDGARLDVQYDPTVGTTPAASTDPVAWKRDWGPGPAPVDPLQTRAIALVAGEGSVGQRLDVVRTRVGLQVAQRIQPQLVQSSKVEKRDASDPKFADDVAQAASRVEAGQQAGTLWMGLQGHIVSGSDWALIRTDGVLEITGRLALQSADDPDYALLTMTMAGSVDLDASGTSGPPGSTLDQRFVDAVGKGIPMALATTFEAGRTAPSWAPDRMKRQAAGFWKYARLTRAQFITVGNVKSAPHGYDLAGTMTLFINVDVYELRARVSP